MCDVLKLSFGENVGLTPRDVYWLWITREAAGTWCSGSTS